MVPWRSDTRHLLLSINEPKKVLVNIDPFWKMMMKSYYGSGKVQTGLKGCYSILEKPRLE